ncbi:universal stress protein [Arhodomonas sp. SL1]|uniref:universal stress protein n=1 Tax=Arhodomonas sp. SL1 TaxID=3425691 RepID=UPI003F884C20
MFRKLLLPVDLQDSGPGDEAARLAVGLARAHGASIHLLSVFPGVGLPWVSTYFPADSLHRAREDLRAHLQRWAAEHIPEEIPHTANIAEGAPHRRILEEIDRVGADLVVLPSHDESGAERILLGSVATKVVEHSHVSVLVVRHPGG